MLLKTNHLYAYSYMDAIIKRDGCVYSLHFEKGANIDGLKTEKIS